MKIVKKRNVEIMIMLRPYVSESGPNPSGPTTYPTKYIDIGRISAYDDSIRKWSAMKGIAFEGRDEPKVLLTTITIPIRINLIFFAYLNVS